MKTIFFNSIKRAVRYLSFITGIFLVVILITEIVFSLSGFEKIVTLHSMYPEDFKRLPGYYEPNNQLKTLGESSILHTVTINNIGYRGIRNLEIEKPFGKYRIFCLGDSFVFGDGVNDEETFPASLERHLNSASEQKKYEVINAGISGTTITDHIQMLKKGFALHPDFVIYNVYENDLRDLIKIRCGGCSVFEGMLKNMKIKSYPFIFSIYKSVENTSLYTLYQMIFKKKGQDKRKNVQEENYNYYGIIDNYKKELSELKKELDRRNIQYICCFFPACYNLCKDDYDKTSMQLLTEAFQQLNMPYFNILDVFKKSKLSAEDLFFFPRNGHGSVQGYDLAAKALAVDLLKSTKMTAQNNPTNILTLKDF